MLSPFFFFNDTAPTEIYTLSLHDALPISDLRHRQADQRLDAGQEDVPCTLGVFLIETDRTLVDSHCTLLSLDRDRKSTRLNSSHLGISYAVFCLKKKKKQHIYTIMIHITQ